MDQYDDFQGLVSVRCFIYSFNHLHFNICCCISRFSVLQPNDWVESQADGWRDVPGGLWRSVPVSNNTLLPAEALQFYLSSVVFEMSHFVSCHNQRWNHWHHSNCSLGNSYWHAKGKYLGLMFDQCVSPVLLKVIFETIFWILFLKWKTSAKVLGHNICVNLHVWSHRRPSPECSKETLKYLEPYFLQGPEVRDLHPCMSKETLSVSRIIPHITISLF